MLFTWNSVYLLRLLQHCMRKHRLCHPFSSASRDLFLCQPVNMWARGWAENASYLVSKYPWGGTISIWTAPLSLGQSAAKLPPRRDSWTEKNYRRFPDRGVMWPLLRSEAQLSWSLISDIFFIFRQALYLKFINRCRLRMIALQIQIWSTLPKWGIELFKKLSSWWITSD